MQSDAVTAVYHHRPFVYQTELNAGCIDRNGLVYIQ